MRDFKDLDSIQRNCFELLVKDDRRISDCKARHSNPSGADVALLGIDAILPVVWSRSWSARRTDRLGPHCTVGAARMMVNYYCWFGWLAVRNGDKGMNPLVKLMAWCEGQRDNLRRRREMLVAREFTTHEKRAGQIVETSAEELEKIDQQVAEIDRILEDYRRRSEEQPATPTDPGQ